MSIDRLSVLQNLYDSLLQDRKQVEKKLNDNVNRIEEINVFLDSVRDDPESDFRVFSPRSSESIHKDEIICLEKEKIKIEKENHSHYNKLNNLNSQIEDIEFLLKDLVSIAKINEDKSSDEFMEEASDVQMPDEDSMMESNSEIRHIWMLDIQEKERQRIARELHDSSVQNLTHLIHTIELSSMFIDQDPIRAKLELASCSKNLKSVIDEMRETIFNLRPMSFDDLGFKQSIEEYIGNLKQQFDNDIEIEYNVCDIGDNTWGKDKEEFDLILVTVYRIIQEALMNALKYSSAEKIVLNVDSSDEAFHILIKDNGKGFSLEQIIKQKDRHFGISVMKERVYLLNGDISIETEPGRGTEIIIEIPLV